MDKIKETWEITYPNGDKILFNNQREYQKAAQVGFPEGTEIRYERKEKLISYSDRYAFSTHVYPEEVYNHLVKRGSLIVDKEIFWEGFFDER